MNGKDVLLAKEQRLRSLLQGGLAGDAAAYQSFLRELSAHLRSFLRRRLVSLPDDVEDLVQESLLAVHIQRHTYDPGQPVSAWVQAIARYKLVDHLRRSGRHAGALPLDDEAHQLAGPAESAAADARLDLARAMEALPARTRRLIDQVKLQGASVAEAATTAGMTETAAKVAIHRGLQAMARFLSKRRRQP